MNRQLSVNSGRKNDRLYTLDVFIISGPVRTGVVFVFGSLQILIAAIQIYRFSLYFACRK
jgi:hypothetical protein